MLSMVGLCWLEIGEIVVNPHQADFNEIVVEACGVLCFSLQSLRIEQASEIGNKNATRLGFLKFTGNHLPPKFLPVL